MKIFLSLALTMMIVVAGGAVFAVQQFKASGQKSESVIFEIEKGMGSRQIAHDLERQGIISNKWIFLGSLKMKGASSTLKAGEYEIAAHASIKDIQDQLIAGRVVQRKFTIPEGLTSFEIVQILNETDGLSGEIKNIPLEGTLLPDTYHFTRNEPRADKIAQMVEAMTKTHQELWDKRASDLPFSTWEEALTLASIVEKETGKASERKTIAGVFINRLRLGIPLQSDPTVIYALTKGQPKNEGKGPLGRRLLSKDLEIESAYNTYKNAGLPPAPIANPGRDAIEAVLHPENNEFLYFVADGTGGHAFAKTLEGHNKNVAEWRKLRKFGQ
jgi:UPF0755 protein